MATRKEPPQESGRNRRKPAVTPEEQEARLISMAHDLAEKQISQGTASAQVISYFLKLGSSREKLEQERLAHENNLLVAKAKQIEGTKEIKELYEEAIKAIKEYQGTPSNED